jgi:hypothetical protein
MALRKCAATSCQQSLKRPAQEAKEIKQQEACKDEQERHDNNGRSRMYGGHPSQPYGQSILSEAK